LKRSIGEEKRGCRDGFELEKGKSTKEFSGRSEPVMLSLGGRPESQHELDYLTFTKGSARRLERKGGGRRGGLLTTVLKDIKESKKKQSPVQSCRG